MSRRPRVWIVDDSPLQGELCRRALSADCDVVNYESGAAMLESLGPLSLPDVLVLDWYMPDMSGLEVCRFVRVTLNASELPILILTATATSESVLEALDAGANDFVRKPFSEAELRARVATLFRIALLHRELLEVGGRLRIEADFRERFIGILAHDLRQPLNAIMMASHALARGEYGQDRELTRFLDLQMRAASRMQRMIVELLDFSRNRPESGMPLQRRRADFSEIVRVSLEEIRLEHPARRFALTSSGSFDGLWDADRVAQVCSNLIHNALTHGSPHTPINIDLAGAADQVRFSVSNEGEPIPPDVLVTLFQPFRPGRDGHRGHGVGLGLHIVHQIVRAHGGTVVVESDRSTTRFLVEMPRQALELSE